VSRDDPEPDRAGGRDERRRDQETATVVGRHPRQERVDDEDCGDTEADRDARRAYRAAIGLCGARSLDGACLLRGAQDRGVLR
jgi:hypothetical protein